jgi:TolB protein
MNVVHSPLCRRKAPLRALILPLVLIPVLFNPFQAGTYGQTGAPYRGKILFSSYLSGNWEIWSIHPDGTNPIQLTRSPEEKQYPSCSPDGSRIVYGNNQGEIVVAEPDGTAVKLDFIPQQSRYPAWSPDGGKIVFVAFEFKDGKETGDIWVADLRERKVRRCTQGEGVKRNPRWSPDGSAILYSSGRWGSGGRLIEELWLADGEGKNPRPFVSDGHSNVQPAWSPDGKWVAFASNRDRSMDIWLVDRKGKNPRQLTRHRAYEGHPSWSPDGSMISFVSTRRERMEIWVMARDGTDERPLKEFSGSKGGEREPFWCP